MMTGPARPGEADGPEETHIIIIDNGRSGILSLIHISLIEQPRLYASFTTLALLS